MAKYAFISDLHLGQQGKDDWGQKSLLSSKVSNNKIQALKDRIDKLRGGKSYTLIIAGDALDLSLSYLKEALEDFVDLMKALQPQEIIYLNGNHDNHIMMMESEMRQSISHLVAGEFPAAGSLYKCTEGGTWDSTLLGPLLKAQGVASKISLASPSVTFLMNDHGTQVPVYTIHGHLQNDVCSLMTDLLKGKLKWYSHERIAATVNAPLVEFIYWLLGETGEGFGADGLVEQIYTDVKRGNTGQVGMLIDNAVERLMPDGIVNGIPDAWEKKAVKAAGLWILKKALEGDGKASQSSDRNAEPVETRKALDAWLTAVGFDRSKPSIVIQGHTHRADACILYPSIKARNLGSWLAEAGGQPESMLLFLDDDSGELVETFDRV